MQRIEKTQATDAELAERVLARGRGIFQSKETRDRVHRITGGRRSSIRGQQLHPEYVTDYVGTYYTGFGNTDYQTFWPVLYELHATGD